MSQLDDLTSIIPNIIYIDDWFNENKHVLNKKEKLVEFMISNKDKNQFYLRNYNSLSEEERELLFYALLTYF